MIIILKKILFYDHIIQKTCYLGKDNIIGDKEYELQKTR